VEQREISIEEAARLSKTGLKAPVALRITMAGEEVAAFDNLCSVCQEIVKGYISNINKRLKMHSSLREKKAKKEEPEEAEELEIDVE
jgi:hypothetical protein